MHFLSLLVFTAGLASAADVCRTTGANCSGTKVCCLGIVEGRCCNVGGDNDHLLYTLPSNSNAIGFDNANCGGSSLTFPNRNAVRDLCKKMPFKGKCSECLSCPHDRTDGWRAASSGLWRIEGRQKREESLPCAEPDVAIYELDGVEHKVKLGDRDADLVTGWVENGEWDKLAKLEKA